MSETDWPDARIWPVLTVALARARSVASDAALSGDRSALWRAGVVALTWSLLGDSATGYATGAVKAIQDGDIRKEFETRTGTGKTDPWLNEAILFIPGLDPNPRTLTAVPIRRQDEALAEALAQIPVESVLPDIVPIEWEATEAVNPLVVDVAPYRVHADYVNQVVVDASTLGALRLGNVVVSGDRYTVSLYLSDDQFGNPVLWQPGDWVRIQFRTEI